jgi:hypothetical protein
MDMELLTLGSNKLSHFEEFSPRSGPRCFTKIFFCTQSSKYHLDWHFAEQDFEKSGK